MRGTGTPLTAATSRERAVELLDVREDAPGAPDASGGTGAGPTAPGAARRREGWWWAALVVLCVAAVAIALLGFRARSTRLRSERVLATQQARLSHLDARLAAERRQLGAATARSGGDAFTLTEETATLGAVRAQIASTEASVFEDGVSLTSLNTCLNGVQQVLNEIAVGDQSGAAASLRGIETSCQAAEPEG